MLARVCSKQLELIRKLIAKQQEEQEQLAQAQHHNKQAASRRAYGKIFREYHPLIMAVDLEIQGIEIGEEGENRLLYRVPIFTQAQ